MRQLFSLVLLGVLVGLACWPLNLIDHWQDLILHQMPAFSSAGWTPLARGLALAPLVVMPLLLVPLVTVRILKLELLQLLLLLMPGLRLVVWFPHPD